MIDKETMRSLEENSGISKLQLMNNAGKGIYEIIKEGYGLQGKKILVVCYHGNNGGDGFVAARKMCEEAEIDVLFLGDEGRMKEEALINFKKIENNDLIQFLDIEDVDFSDYDIIVDAILGIGIEGSLNENIVNAINGINKSQAKIVAIDIPTGLDPDTGIVNDVLVDADLIITFHDMKKGLAEYKDKVKVVDIGIKSE